MAQTVASCREGEAGRSGIRIHVRSSAIGVGGNVEAGRHWQPGGRHTRERLTFAANSFERRLWAIQIENEWIGLR